MWEKPMGKGNVIKKIPGQPFITPTPACGSTLEAGKENVKIGKWYY